MQLIRQQEDIQRYKAQIRTLQGELAIVNQECRLLGKRPSPADPEETEYLQEAVAREIKKRRRQSICNDAPVTLQERRKTDHASIASVLREHKDLLVPWTTVMAAALKDKMP